MPRGRKKSLKFKIKGDTLKSIGGMLLVFFSFLSYVAFFFPQYSVNEVINNLYRRFFGYTAYLIPLIFLSVGLLLLGFRWRVLQARIFAGLLGVILAMGPLLHSIYSGKRAYEMALKGYGGGLIGYKLLKGLSESISFYGAFFVYILILFISVLLLADISTEKIISFVNSLVEKIKEFKIPTISFRLPSRKEATADADLKSVALSGDTKSPTETTTETSKSASYKIETTSTSAVEIVPLPVEPLSNSMPTTPPQEDTNATKLTTLAVASKEPGSLPYANRVWTYPPLELLVDAPATTYDPVEVKRRQKTIEDTLKSFGIAVTPAGANVGPTVTQYAYAVPPGTRITKISNLQAELAMHLESITGSVRLEIPIPGRNAIGVEVPNTHKSLVYFKEVLLSDQMKSAKSKLTIGMGKDVSGAVRVYDLAKMPHLLVAGATGSGKSVFLHSVMFSILYRASPQEVKFILIDPKRVELVNYNGIPHLQVPVITDMEKAPSAFRWACNEMARRYKLFEAARARNIEIYNENSGFQALPYIVIIVDELADLMVVDANSVERSIVRLSQLSRATGIHMILTMQRPSADILTGLIKANIPSRIAFNVASQVDSRVILDQPGAEKLTGRGDMLFIPPDLNKPIRIQGSWISDGEINKLVEWLKNTGFTPDYKEEVLETPDEEKKPNVGLDGKELDDLYERAVEVVTTAGKASTSFLQRRLSIGYTRAARIMDQLEENGVISPPEAGKERQVYRTASQKDDALNFVDNQSN